MPYRDLRRAPARLRVVLMSLSFACLGASAAVSDDELTVDAGAAHHAFPHFWEQMFGSGRAILSLRESYRHDLKAVKQVTDLHYVRFHAILHDEVGVYDEDKDGSAVYNFSYVDQIYDGLLANGVRPFVELSFMPQKLASRPAIHSFKYHPIVAPPRDYARWDALIEAFAAHLVKRYGIDEVAQWYFEVWNEPNIDFWVGKPAQATYWTLYDHTARSLKHVDARLRVGGPATAQAAWVRALIRHTTSHQVPLDFVSTHVYGNDTAENLFKTHEEIPRDAMVCRAAKKVHDEVAASARPDLPIIWSEYNASYLNEPQVTDSVFMGPWLADTLRRCDGLTSIMAYWTFSDVFEEQGVVRRPFYGGYGLMAAGGVPKPAFNAFKMLHELGDERLDLDADYALLTRRKDGSLVLALWNYVPPGKSGVPRTVQVRLKNASRRSVRVQRLDADHGDVAAEYVNMGSPVYPTTAELERLTKAAQLPAPEEVPVVEGRLAITLPANGLVTVAIPGP